MDFVKPLTMDKKLESSLIIITHDDCAQFHSQPGLIADAKSLGISGKVICSFGCAECCGGEGKMQMKMLEKLFRG